MKASKINSIVIAIDFENPSRAATEHSVKLAKFLKAKVVLTHIIENDYLLPGVFSLTEQQQEQLRQGVVDKLKGIGKEYLEKEGITFEIDVREGKAHHEILKVVEENNARLLIIGKDSEQKIEYEIAGSNATRMIMKSSAPVICVTGDENSIDYKNIVLPLDLTKSVRLQVFNAISFGLHFKSKIHLVSAINAGVPFRKSRIFRKMRKVQKTIVENGVECTMELFKRSHELPYKVVQKYAHEIGGDLIMIMTHSENITSDNYIGAFAHHIVNESRIPVISFSHKAAEEDEGDFFTTLLDPLRIFKK